MRIFNYGIITLLIFVINANAFADYAWIPVRRKLVLRTGAEWNKTYENFDTDGFIADFSVNGQLAEVRDFNAYVFGEYGIADRWSMWMKASFVDSAASAQATNVLIASGTGLGDTFIGFKHAFTTSYPMMTAETYFKFPTGSSEATAVNEMVTGEGNLDLGLRLHIGARDGQVLFAFSPGLLMRFGGYATAGTLELAVQYNHEKLAYGRLYAEGALPFSEEALPPSTLVNHNLPGTAGSYMKLAASPMYFGMGVRAGYNFLPSFGVETFAGMTFQGKRTARNLKFGFNLIFNMDFYEADYRPRLKEVKFTGQEDDTGNFD